MIKHKYAIKVLIIINFLLSMTFSYTFWASSISGSTNHSTANVAIGTWTIGTAITNEDELSDFFNGNLIDPYNIFYLANDINVLTPSKFTYNEVVFDGTFEGNGYEITDISFESTGTGTAINYLGMFAIIENATIRNLTIRSIGMLAYVSNTNLRSGIIAGEARGTNTIENIRIYDSKAISIAQGSGLLVGRVKTGANLNVSNIIVRNSIAYAHDNYAGGLFGYIESNATVDIKDTDLIIHAHARLLYAGGVVGYLEDNTQLNVIRAIIEYSSQNMNVSGGSGLGDYTDYYVGGIIGYNGITTSGFKPLIKDVFVTGDVRVKTTDTTHIKYQGAIASRRDEYTAGRTKRNNVYSAELYLKNGLNSYGGVLGYHTKTAFRLDDLPGSGTSDTWAVYFPRIVSKTKIWAQTGLNGRPELKL